MSLSGGQSSLGVLINNCEKERDNLEKEYSLFVGGLPLSSWVSNH